MGFILLEAPVINRLSVFTRTALVVLALSLFAMPPAQSERSPVFGSASVATMSTAAAQAVTAKGFWADYFGTLAVNSAYTAYIFAYYARFIAASDSPTAQNWYLSAMNNSYNAYIYS